MSSLVTTLALGVSLMVAPHGHPIKVRSCEGRYTHCVGLVKRLGADGAARAFVRAYGGERTPDGAVYNLTCVREALRGIV